MRLGATSLSVTKPGAVRKIAAVSSSSESSESNNTLPDIDTYSHVRFDKININDNAQTYGVGISSDGTTLFTLWKVNNYNYIIQQQNLSTAFDISSHGSSTGSFNAKTDGVSIGTPYGFRFADNGSKLYVGDSVGNVKHYNLSTQWDITTRTFIRKIDVGYRFAGIFWKPDGSVMFYVDYGNDRLYSNNVSTAWDLSTITSTNMSVRLDSIASINDESPLDIYFSNDGLKLYILGAVSDYIYQYNLSTAWDITSSSFGGTADKTLYVGTQEIYPNGIDFSPDGTHLYIAGTSGDGIDQYVSS